MPDAVVLRLSPALNPQLLFNVDGSNLPERKLFTRTLKGTKSVVPMKFASAKPAFPVVAQGAPTAAAAPTAMFCQLSPLLNQKVLVFISYTSIPFVCGIFILWAVVIRGISNPLLEDLI